jgi:hypothetical protein
MMSNPDGIARRCPTRDKKGRPESLQSSGGIWIIAPSGAVIGIAQMPEVIRNLPFGGPDAPCISPRAVRC